MNMTQIEAVKQILDGARALGWFVLAPRMKNGEPILGEGLVMGTAAYFESGLLGPHGFAYPREDA
jgi:hypothetical protein